MSNPQDGGNHPHLRHSPTHHHTKSQGLTRVHFTPPPAEPVVSKFWDEASEHREKALVHWKDAKNSFTSGHLLDAAFDEIKAISEDIKTSVRPLNSADAHERTALPVGGKPVQQNSRYSR